MAEELAERGKQPESPWTFSQQQWLGRVHWSRSNEVALNTDLGLSSLQWNQQTAYFAGFLALWYCRIHPGKQGPRGSCCPVLYTFTTFSLLRFLHDRGFILSALSHIASDRGQNWDPLMASSMNMVRWYHKESGLVAKTHDATSAVFSPTLGLPRRRLMQ